MKKPDFSGLNANELKEKLNEYRKQLFDLRFQHATKQLENTSLLKATRKNIARVSSLLAQQNAVKA